MLITKIVIPCPLKTP